LVHSEPSLPAPQAAVRVQRTALSTLFWRPHTAFHSSVLQAQQRGLRQRAVLTHWHIKPHFLLVPLDKGIDPFPPPRVLFCPLSHFATEKMPCFFSVFLVRHRRLFCLAGSILQIDLGLPSTSFELPHLFPRLFPFPGIVPLYFPERLWQKLDPFLSSILVLLRSLSEIAFPPLLTNFR